MTTEQLINNKRFFDELYVPYAIGGSTLLGIYRDGEAIEGDHEFDVFMTVKDIESSKLKLYADSILESKSNNGLIKLSVDGIVTVSPIMRLAGVEYTNPSDKNYFIFQRDILTPYLPFTFKDEIFPIVRNPELYFYYYYGENWRTPTKDWHWTQSPMMQQAEHINKLIKEDYE